MRYHFILHGFIFAMSNMDYNFKEKFVNSILDNTNDDDLFTVYPKKEGLTRGFAAAEIFNHEAKCDNLCEAIQETLINFNKVEEFILKKLFVFTDYINGINDEENKLIEKINTSFTQLFFLGIGKDVKNFAFLADAKTAINFCGEEMRDETDD